MLLRSLHLESLLSFGPGGVNLEMRPLNVLIGPNGSGKSNLIDIFSLLAAAPHDIQEPLRTGGGFREWLWKAPGPGTLRPRVEARFGKASAPGPRYVLEFDPLLGSLDEAFEWDGVPRGELLAVSNEIPRTLRWGDDTVDTQRVAKLEPTQSLLSKPHLAGRHAAVQAISEDLGSIRIYRDWDSGRHSVLRRPQPTDARNDQLASDGSNLGLILSALRREPAVKERLLTALRRLYDGITDFEVIVQGGAVQIFLHEGARAIPAMRLSDGTLRYLCLLAVLCHPTPPSLVCIEEPELGLHPDIIPGLADLLREASEHTQLVVTTHSDLLVDALTEAPESVVICEREERGTQLRRLDTDRLRAWLGKYRLGELWMSGELGGKRW